jgi:hypothetical protein
MGKAISKVAGRTNAAAPAAAANAPSSAAVTRAELNAALTGASIPEASAAAAAAVAPPKQPIRLSPTPRTPPPATSSSSSSSSSAAVAVAVPGDVYDRVGVMADPLLEAMQELGPLEKTTYTTQPTSPLSGDEKRLLSAIEVRHGRTVTAEAAEEQRDRPVSREAVRSEDQEEEWRAERAEEGSGRLSEVQAQDLLALRRGEDGVGGDTGASVADLAGMFKLDLATVEAIVATVAAPHYSYDKREGIERGTREPRMFPDAIPSSSSSSSSSSTTTGGATAERSKGDEEGEKKNRGTISLQPKKRRQSSADNSRGFR